MYFPSVAILTLTVLIAGELTANASDSMSLEDRLQGSVTQERAVSTPTVTPKIIESTAPVAAQQSSIQKAQALAVEPLAAAIPQGYLGKEAKVLPNNMITESSAVDVSYPKEELPVAGIFKAEALGSQELNTKSPIDTKQLIAAEKPATVAKCASAKVESSDSIKNLAKSQLLAQARTTEVERCPRPEAVAPLVLPEIEEDFGASPALSIYIPVGFGADNNTVFLTGSYQASVREDDGSVGAGGIGIGLGDAKDGVGFELSYALETTDDEFGEGGFNAKLHRRFSDDFAGALGWNGFVNIGRNDFEQSKYGVLTKIFRTQDSINDAFSRVAVTVGVGDGQFRSNGAVDAGDNNINVFGNVAVRIARPVSFIAEWTGQDLGLGLSIAPFRNFPLVITPAVRDVAGAGDGARFVLGTGVAFRF